MAADFTRELQLVSIALNEILSISSTGEQRRAAHEVIESFKKSSTNCADTGLAFYLDKTNGAAVRHIGLTFIEEYFKNNWNLLDRDQHTLWKGRALDLLKNAEFAEPGHIKESIARLVVELVKREWPQNWGSLLSELEAIRQKGAVQLEMTLLVFLRLAEDVMLSLDPHLHQQRRKNIEQGLSEKMDDLFQFFVTTLKNNVGSWKDSKQPVNLRLAEASLFTLTAYLGHVSLEHILANNSILLQMLCYLLKEPELQMASAECLSIITERRKDRVDIRLPLLILFSDDVMDLFIDVARKAAVAGADEESYKFLKKIADILTGLGTCQLADIWGNDRGTKRRPDGFERYLKLILDLVNHQSQVICLKAASVISLFLKHELISKDDVFIEAIPHFMAAFGNKLLKCGDPSESNHPSCEYSALDHDSSEDFSLHFGKLRSCLTSIIRECASIAPLEGFQQVYKKIIDLNVKRNIEDVLIWESAALFSDAVLTRFWKSEVLSSNESANVIEAANKLLQVLIQFDSKVPQLMVHALSCLQSFFSFFRTSQTFLLSVVEKILLTFTNFPGSFNDKDVVAVCRQASSCFVNLCKENSSYLVPHFDALQSYVTKLQLDRVLSNLEHKTLTEGLLLISNDMSQEKREEFIVKLLNDLKQATTDESFKRGLETAESFVAFIGLTEPPEDNTPAIQKRNEIASLIQTLQGIVRRIRLTPAEEETLKAKKGFFQDISGPTWIQKLVSFLPVVIKITRHLGLIWSPQIQNMINKDYLPAFQLHESDRYYLLGQHLSKEIKETLSCTSSIIGKATTFLHTLHFNSYTLLGQLGGFLEEYFYNIDGLADMIINDIMTTWVFLPKYRFITVLKKFFKNFVCFCPVSCYPKVISPFMSQAAESMFKLLTQEWDVFLENDRKGTKTESSQSAEENPDDAVMAERLMYSFSREYIEMLVAFFLHKKKDSELLLEVDAPSTVDGSNAEMGELGKYFLDCEAINRHVIFTLFAAVTWPDTVSVNKVVRVIPHIINFIHEKISTESKIDSSIIDSLFISILRGLEVHGAEISTQGSLVISALLMYMNLRCSYPSLVRIMLMVPSCKKEELMKFDLDVFEGECKLTEKKKRELFRKFLSDAFGKNVSEIYKANIHIKDLPPLTPRKKIKPHIADDVGESICGLFGQDS